MLCDFGWDAVALDTTPNIWWKINWKIGIYQT